MSKSTKKMIATRICGESAFALELFCRRNHMNKCDAMERIIKRAATDCCRISAEVFGRPDMLERLHQIAPTLLTYDERVSIGKES